MLACIKAFQNDDDDDDDDDLKIVSSPLAFVLD